MRKNVSASRVVGWLGGPMVLYMRTIVCTDERGTFRYLEIAPNDEPDLWKSTFVF